MGLYTAEIQNKVFVVVCYCSGAVAHCCSDVVELSHTVVVHCCTVDRRHCTLQDYKAWGGAGEREGGEILACSS